MSSYIDKRLEDGTMHPDDECVERALLKIRTAHTSSTEPHIKHVLNQAEDWLVRELAIRNSKRRAQP